VGALSEEMKRLVDRQRLGFVATVSPDSTPNLSPKGTVSVLDDDHLVFADLRSPKTVANLRINPNVEVNVVDPFTRKGYRFKGKAQVLHSGAEFDKLVVFFSSNRALSDAPRRIRAIVVIRVEQAKPVVSPAYDHDTDERAMRERWIRYYVGDENR
jgi:uncharacterized protein